MFRGKLTKIESQLAEPYWKVGQVIDGMIPALPVAASSFFMYITPDGPGSPAHLKTTTVKNVARRGTALVFQTENSIYTLENIETIHVIDGTEKSKPMCTGLLELYVTRRSSLLSEELVDQIINQGGSL